MKHAFTIAAGDETGNLARAGELAIGDVTIHTPAYIAPSSRGQIPHLTADNLERYTDISCVYTAYEDYAENLPDVPSTYGFFHGRPATNLRSFNGIPARTCSILGPRRLPPVLSPKNNKQDSIGICTALGYRDLPLSHYYESLKIMRPDAFLAPLSLSTLISIPTGRQQIAKMVDRTQDWVSQSLLTLSSPGDTQSQPNLWIPLIPVPAEQQHEYLAFLESSLGDKASGIVFHDIPGMNLVPPSMLRLPRMSVDVNSTGPHHTLHLIQKAIDLIAVPYVNSASDDGMALCFQFEQGPSFSVNNQSRALAIDLGSPIYRADDSPIDEKCPCYACASHSRAYIHHLLAAEEMLAWVLLQIHNYRCVDNFFKEIRSSIKRGDFSTRKSLFDLSYHVKLPVRSGSGPRRRGYQMNPQGAGPSKANKTAYFKSLPAEVGLGQLGARETKSESQTSWLVDDDEYNLNFEY